MFLDTGRGDRPCNSSADNMDRRDHPLFQPLGQNSDAAALPARLQAGTIESMSQNAYICVLILVNHFLPYNYFLLLKYSKYDFFFYFF